MSALKRALPLLIVAFVSWTLWRHAVRPRGTRGMLPSTEPGTAAKPDLATAEPGRPTLEPPSTMEVARTADDDVPSAEQSTEPPVYTDLSRVRWEPPARSDPSIRHSPDAHPATADQADSASRRRGRMEDLLERARNEDEGAA